MILKPSVFKKTNKFYRLKFIQLNVHSYFIILMRKPNTNCGLLSERSLKRLGFWAIYVETNLRDFSMHLILNLLKVSLEPGTEYARVLNHPFRIRLSTISRLVIRDSSSSVAQQAGRTVVQVWTYFGCFAR